MREKEYIQENIYIQENKTIVYIRKRIYIDNRLSDSIENHICGKECIYRKNCFVDCAETIYIKNYNMVFTTNCIYTEQCIYKESIYSFGYIGKNIYRENYLLEHI